MPYANNMSYENKIVPVYKQCFEVNTKIIANDKLEIGIYYYSSYIPTKMQTVW